MGAWVRIGGQKNAVLTISHLAAASCRKKSPTAAFLKSPRQVVPLLLFLRLLLRLASSSA